MCEEKMGTFLDKPKTDKCNEHGEGNGLRYGVSSMQGWRVEMEDAHCAITGLGQGLEDWSFFAIFDGHAGSTVSNKCAELMLDSIIKSTEFQEDIAEGIRTGFLRLDSRLREQPDLASGKDKAGSTAVCALISPYNIYIANCGDSRAVISRNAVPIFASKDHKPCSPSERERIQEAGGTVMMRRVNGSLAVSRSLGDFEYKKVAGRGPFQQLVSPEPEIQVLRRNKIHEFLILACDGIWDVMSTLEVCHYLDYQMMLTDDLECIANRLIDTCLCRGSRDNMSVIIVALAGTYTPNETAIRLDKETDSIIENKIRDIMTSDDPISHLSELKGKLEEVKIPFLPFGLNSKQSLIESVFKEFVPEQNDTLPEPISKKKNFEASHSPGGKEL